MFEQTGAVLEKRFGFRVQEYGLRNVFPRIPDHPVLAGLTVENLRDWRGASTLLPPQLDYEMRPRYGPTIQWCDIPVTRVWRCGNRGNVASALIEKPARGDFLPILDGGYCLQYSPLLEFREGSGIVVFCQLDVTGRSESDPAADRIGANLLEYVSNWKPQPKRGVAYVGEPAGQKFLEAAGISLSAFDSAKLQSNQLLIIGPNAAGDLAPHRDKIAAFIKSGGAVLAIGQNQDAVNQFLPFQITTRDEEHISSFFESGALNSVFAGVNCADVHNRDPRKIPLVVGGAEVIGDGVLARAKEGRVVFCQIAPWQFDGEQENLRRTRRHVAVLFARLLANLGAEFKTPIVERFSVPIAAGKNERRWSEGLYLDQPEEWDDPYRFFRW